MLAENGPGPEAWHRALHERHCTLHQRHRAACGFWAWRDLLPLRGLDRRVSLGEGGTPLRPGRRHAETGLWWKDETRNPTGSHKDRALALAVSDALSRDARLVAVFSAGSTGLSCAAYAARAGLPAAILMTRGAPTARIAPLAALGATLIEVEAEIDEGIARLADLAGHDGIYVASTTRAANPVQAEAGRTLAFEIVADLGRAPDQVVIPVGGGGTIAALHDGFVQLRAMGVTDRLPRLIAVVPDRYDTLATALARGVTEEAAFLALPAPAGGATVLNKIAHAHPPDGPYALRALRESDGRVLSFSDAAAVEAVLRLGREEGIYLEPSSAILLCALETLHAEGALAPEIATVAIACGSGFRETHVTMERHPPARHPTALDDLGPRLAALAVGRAG